MRKKEFLKQLKENLHGLANEDIEEILEDYEEHFKAGKKHGRKETEIAKSLGDPKVIAGEAKKELLDDKEPLLQLNIRSQIRKFAKQGSDFLVKIRDKEYFRTVCRSKKNWFIFLNLLAIPVWIAIICSIIGLFLSGIGIIVFGIISASALVFSLAMPFALPFNNLILSGLWSCFGLICFGIIFSIISWDIKKMYLRLTGKYVKWYKKSLLKWE